MKDRTLELQEGIEFQERNIEEYKKDNHEWNKKMVSMGGELKGRQEMKQEILEIIDKWWDNSDDLKLSYLEELKSMIKKEK